MKLVVLEFLVSLWLCGVGALGALAPSAYGDEFVPAQPAMAQASGASTEETAQSIKIESQPKKSSAGFDQLFTVQAGKFEPESVQVDNGSYTFNYGNSSSNPVSSYLVELGWAPKLWESGGSFYFEENLAVSSFQGHAVAADAGAAALQLGGTSYTLLLFGFDTRLLYVADWFPWKRLMPFVDGGYQYTLYYQPGSSGFESAQGGVGNPVAGAGLRFWLNKDSSLAGGMPVFLVAKANRIFPRQGALNLSSDSVFGGLSIGL